MTRTWLPVSRPVKLASAGLLLAASGTCLAIATRTVGLWWPILWCLIGAGVGMAGLLIVNDLIADLLGDDPAPGAQWAGLGIGLAGTIIGIVGTLAGMRRANTPLAIAGLLVALVSVLVVLISVRSRTAARPGLLVGVGVAGMVPLVVAAAAGNRFDLAVGATIVCWLVGLTIAKLGLAPWIDAAPTPCRKAVTIGAAVAVVFGIGALVLGARWHVWWLVALAVSLIIGGLSALGISLPRWDLRPAAPWLIGAGGVAVVAGLVLTAVVLRAFGPAVVGGGMVAAIGAWFVFRGEGLLAVTLIGYVIVWGLVGRTTDDPPDPAPDAPTRILAIGDSYISGEGARFYFPGTNVVGADRNECRRAPTAYPVLLARELGMGLDFFACSGAKAAELTDHGQMPDSPPEVAGARAQLAQWELLPDAQRDATAVVLLSIGGNDVGFSTIVKACLLPEDCTALEPQWLSNVKTLGDTLERTYTEVRRRVPGRPVIVVPYPRIVDASKSCGVGLTKAELAFVGRFIDALDAQIDRAATDAGVRTLTDAPALLGGHLLCDDEPAANQLHLSPPGGDWLRRYLPSTWIHGSMHPRAQGHELLAEALRQPVRDAVDEGRSSAANPSPRDQAPTTISPQERDESEEAKDALTDREWVNRQLRHTAYRLLPLAIVLLSGGLVLALGLSATGWRIVDGLRPRTGNPPDG